MTGDRRSDKHSPRVDEALEAEVRSEILGGRPTRAEEWRQAEPEADDQRAPYPRGGPAPGTSEGLDPQAVELRSELARHTERSTFPADREALERYLTGRNAPDPLVSAVHGLPPGRSFHNPDEAVHALLGTS